MNLKRGPKKRPASRARKHSQNAVPQLLGDTLSDANSITGNGPHIWTPLSGHAPQAKINTPLHAYGAASQHKAKLRAIEQHCLFRHTAGHCTRPAQKAPRKIVHKRTRTITKEHYSCTLPHHEPLYVTAPPRHPTNTSTPAHRCSRPNNTRTNSDATAPEGVAMHCLRQHENAAPHTTTVCYCHNRRACSCLLHNNNAKPRLRRQAKQASPTGFADVLSPTPRTMRPPLPLLTQRRVDVNVNRIRKQPLFVCAPELLQHRPPHVRADDELWPTKPDPVRHHVSTHER